MRINWSLKKLKPRRFTFMVIPDASRSVMRFRFTNFALYLVAALIIAMIALSLSIYFIAMHNAKAKLLLTAELEKNKTIYNETISTKDDTIGKLQSDLIELSQQTEKMKAKMAELNKLEEEIKAIAKIDMDKEKQLPVKIASANNEQSSGGKGGLTEQLDEDEMQKLIASTHLDLQTLSANMDHLMSSFTDAKKQIQAYEYLLKVTPSMWPTVSREITSGYGYREDPFTGRWGVHDGIDIGGNLNDPVYVTADGVVDYTGYDSYLGRYIVVKHENGIKTRYQHLNKILVKAGQKVKKGATIGRLGSTGRSTGPHLHYTVFKNGVIVNPLPYTHPPGKE
ncbi:MAG TPA: M23 family metallopeptidase [Bacilli bacterium]